MCDVTLYVNLDRGWLIVFFKNGKVVWFQGIALLSTPRSKSFPCRLFVYHKESCSKNELD